MNRSSQLLNKISQGKALKLVSLSPSSSHFLSDGTYTRFADWRFIHKARLNLVPLNGCQPWKTGEEKMCRRWGQWAETLPHVINHCSLHSHGWQLRRNAIADRIVKALQPKATILSVNQNVWDTNLRPDITAKVGNTVYVIDVTCPFEGSDTAFISSYENKINKYEPLLPLYRAQGLNPVIVPILVGALGSWCPWNDRICCKKLSRIYLAKFRKLCVSDCIKWSRDIYTEHITGHRQYLTDDLPAPISHSPNENIPSSINHSLNFLLLLLVSPGGVLYDKLSPPAPSSSYFQAEGSDIVSPRSNSQLPNQCQSAFPDGSEHLADNLAVGEVDLFPSDMEVKDLFPDHTTSPRFDFLKLTCLPCKRKFFSAGGLENHLYAVHDVRIHSSCDTPISAGNPPQSDNSSHNLAPPELFSFGPMTGPPKSPPFPSLTPDKTYASVAAKPTITSSQPWTGQQLDTKSIRCTTPRRPIPSRPSRVTAAAPKSTVHSAPIPANQTRKKITFHESPDQVSHPVLLPVRPPKKVRKTFPCLHCDFKFRTLKSRDEHLVVHRLEDEFNRLHGIVSNSNNSDFDDFALPRPPSSQPKRKSSRTASTKAQHPTSSSSQSTTTATRRCWAHPVLSHL
ncbi:retrovirus-related Pol polyprotein from type-2 retrotransposable element R2DM [Caerostris darwini]|uniref:Retrovirus-related Pol polyprotein from type-2 retrotransposable element R2DM n=1 Tax=Caerostris darwini TaxID=1538125 RepID=A0AAV4S9G3_9ARAC|nr:retrovirus-related Pol polyprotein from type-2 retrotransposable element R2DM [Caerostris darwini]